MLRRFFRHGGWLPLLCLPIAAIALFVWISGGEQARALARDGVPVDARVAVLQFLEGNRLASSTALRSDRYLVTVVYQVEGGAELTESRSVSKAFFASLTAQQTLPIRVLPSDPTVIEIEPGWVEGNSNAAGWVGLGFLGLGLLPLPLIWRSAAGALRISRAGIPRQGKVLEIIAIKQSRAMRFGWQGGDGAMHGGQSRLRGREFFAAHPVGSAITVLEDPANPARAIWETDLR
jgi:hypothetical protein